MERLRSILQSLVSLANFTTLRVGGKAEFFAEPHNSKELLLLINWANKQNIRCQVLGAGSNTLITDNLFDRVVIKYTNNLNNISLHLLEDYLSIRQV